MTALRTSLVAIGGAAVLLVLLVVGVGSNDPLEAFITVGVALGVAVLIGIGPERMGLGLLLVAMFLSPLYAYRIVGNVTYSDLAFVVAFGLLIPRMITKRPALPPMYVIGVAILFVGGIISSLLSPLPVASLAGFARIVAAMMVLPLLVATIQPSLKMVDWMAGAYILGQITSTGYSLVLGSANTGAGRAGGLSTHPNFYALSGQMSYALCIYLFYRVQRRHRWIVVLAGTISLYSVISSGSRASLLCCALMTVVWPLVERSAVTWYVALSVGILTVLAAEPLLRGLGQGNALDRLTGGSGSQYSNIERTWALETGLERFLARPLQGNGWDSILEIHNAYLEVAVGGGVICVLGFVLILVSLTRPLFRQGTPNRLAFAGLSYAAFAMIGPTLYDRILWAALALILVASAQETAPEPDEQADPEPAVADRKLTGARRPRPR